MGGARQDEQFADAVHESGEEGDVAVHLRELARDDKRHRRGPGAALPQGLEMRTDILDRVRLRHLAQRVRERGGTQQIESHAGHAVRRSVTCRRVGFSAAEFAICSTRPTSTGS